MSAGRPGAISPAWSAILRCSAATTVAAWMASSGVMPACTRSANSWALSPCAETPESVPKAIRTPPSCARRAMSSIFGPASSAFAVWAGVKKLVGLAATRATKSPASRVGTR